MARFKIISTRWRSAESGWSVLNAVLEGEKGECAVVGHFPPLERGEELDVEGEWGNHPKYGRQFKAKSFTIAQPSEGEGVVRFFASGSFRSIRTKRAEAIVAHFGPLAIEILRKEPKRIGEVPGFGRRSVKLFLEDWEQLSTWREALMLLTSAGIGSSLSTRICKHYGEETLEVLRKNPYQLCDTIWGVGFGRADKIALANGLPIDSVERLEAALIHTLQLSTLDGHTYLPREQLLQKGATLLQGATSRAQGVDEERLSLFAEQLYEELPQVLQNLTTQEKLINSEGAIYLPQLHRDELTVAEWVRVALQRRARSIDPARLERALTRWSSAEGVDLDPLQRQAVLRAARAPLYLLTGGPGTGKTTALKGLVYLLGSAGVELLLAAPTGRAARRMSEVTGLNALTIHRLLEFDPKAYTFRRNQNNPFFNKCLIVDEISMVDLSLMASLLKALDSNCTLILVGDADQLPSIGPGTLFRDLLSYDKIESTRLMTIHRQGADSAIALNAQRINRGEMPRAVEAEGVEGNFHLIATHSAEESRDQLLSLVTEIIPEKYGVHPIDDIQVLIPMHKGILGTEELNRALQERLNPHGRKFRIGPVDLCEGDKVMQFKNDYESNIFNGDIGRIVGEKKNEPAAIIDFGEWVAITAEKIDQIGLAYASTIHKSQGSEYPIVVVALDRSHHRMLQRTLLYTAVTRAKKEVFLIGPPAAILQAVKSEPTVQRYSRLPELLRQGEDFLLHLHEEP